MSRKLSSTEMIFTPIYILVLVIGVFVAGVYYNFSNEQIIKLFLPLSILATVIDRLINRNRKIDQSLLLNANERRSELKVIWAAVYCLFTIVMIAIALFYIDYLAKKGHEIPLSCLILILIVFPLVVLASYLIKRSRI